MNTYTRPNPLDNDLSGGWCYPAFEQLGPGFHRCSIFLSCLFIFFFRGLTLQKFIDVIFSSLDYCSLQNLSKALPSVNYRPAAQFFPFSVFCFPRSVFCMNESMAAAEGQSRLTPVITTKQTNTQS